MWWGNRVRGYLYVCRMETAWFYLKPFPIITCHLEYVDGLSGEVLSLCW